MHTSFEYTDAKAMEMAVVISASPAIVWNNGHGTRADKWELCELLAVQSAIGSGASLIVQIRDSREVVDRIVAALGRVHGRVLIRRRVIMPDVSAVLHGCGWSWSNGGHLPDSIWWHVWREWLTKP